MELSIIKILNVFGAICFMLFGIKFLSQGVQKALGRKFRKVLEHLQQNKFKSATWGILMSASIQSSSAVTTMAASMVNSEILALNQAMSFIMGANVGTTLLPWLIATFGFGMSIWYYSMPLLGIGFVASQSKKQWLASLGEVLLGFGILFFGTQTFTHFLPMATSSQDLFLLSEVIMHSPIALIIVGLLAGFLFTFIVQASAVTFFFACLLLASGWITFPFAVAIMIGQNIGSCIRPVIASRKANVWARRTVMGNLLFNIFTAIIFIIAFYPITNGIMALSEFSHFPINHLQSFVLELPENPYQYMVNNPLVFQDYHRLVLYSSIALALCHTLFNFIGLNVMFWFTAPFTQLVQKLVKAHDDDDEMWKLAFISGSLMATSELSLLQARNEIFVYAKRVRRMIHFNRSLYKLEQKEPFNVLFERLHKYENIANHMEVEIANYMGKVAEGKLSDKSKKHISNDLDIVSELESVADSCASIGNLIHSMKSNKISFSESMNANIEIMFNLVDSAYEHTVKILHLEKYDEKIIDKLYETEYEINQLRDEVKAQNIEDLEAKKYHYQVGVLYLDIIAECEKIGDYLENVTDSMKKILPPPTETNEEITH